MRVKRLEVGRELIAGAMTAAAITISEVQAGYLNARGEEMSWWMMPKMRVVRAMTAEEEEEEEEEW